MINFTVGPVQSSEAVLAIGAQQTPYFRTSEFSDLMFENEALMKKYTNVGDDGRAVFVTGSGTASMEAVMMNFFDERDRILVVNGGSFGQRFVDLCRIHGYHFTAIELEPGRTLDRETLEKFDGGDYTAFVVNVHETSTGVYYDLGMIGEFCRKNGLFLVVDAISSFLADPLDMQKDGVNVMITGSQKALACPPGVSIIVMDKTALDRLQQYDSGCLYLDIKGMLKDGERGQTPFTPAVSTLIQIHERLCEIEKNGGVEAEIERTHHLAEYFRDKIKDLPFKIFSNRMSNAVTPLSPENCSARDIFLTLKDEYGIWICPNGGDLADKVFRVGHIGALTENDYDTLIDALNDMNKRGLL